MCCTFKNYPFQAVGQIKSGWIHSFQAKNLNYLKLILSEFYLLEGVDFQF